MHPVRALSSVGSEHLPYKQGVTGSNPVGPTSSTIPMEFTPSGFLFSKRLKFTSQEYGKQKSKYALKRIGIVFAGAGSQWICNPVLKFGGNKKISCTQVQHDFPPCLRQAGFQKWFPNGYAIQF